ncbi:hypothetical protein [Undibacterium sp. KW1]|uniref:hypothetical protein n=1 Tax=Undibacterium sp. KW1 TaxID=2058624 RepID=UPI001389C5BD|nr:hypothetical protein [Undibacterium sp. KW1]
MKKADIYRMSAFFFFQKRINFTGNSAWQPLPALFETLHKANAKRESTHRECLLNLARLFLKLT